VAFSGQFNFAVAAGACCGCSNIFSEASIALRRVFSQGCSVSHPQLCDVSDKIEAAKPDGGRA